MKTYIFTKLVILSLLMGLLSLFAFELKCAQKLNGLPFEKVAKLADQLSVQDEKQIIEFFKQHEQEIKPLTNLEGFRVWKKVFATNNSNLKKAGLQNIESSVENYGIPLTNTAFILEIAGPGNRWQNIVQYLGKMSDSDAYTYAIHLGQNVKENKKKLHNFRHDIETLYQKNPIPTYQALSRIFLGNTLAKQIQDKHLTHIKQPHRYLVKYPWAPENAPINDINYAVVEDHINNARHIVDTKYLDSLAKKGTSPTTIQANYINIKEIPVSLIPQILEAFKAGLWNFNALFKDGDIYFANTEQPNSASPELIAKGFNAQDSFWRNRIKNAFIEFASMLKTSGTKAQQEAFRKFIISDKETQELPFYDMIKDSI